MIDSLTTNDDTLNRMYIFNKHIHEMGLQMAMAVGRNGCHVGGSFSCMEIFSVLYGGVLQYHVDDPRWDERDRFIPSKTHCILANFPALVEAGFLPKDQLLSFFQDGGLLAGHPWNVDIGLEFPGGSLGMGLSVGIGIALEAKRKGKQYRTYVLLGDGECNEGSVWEGFMAAPHFGLNNLTVIIDYNNMQFDGANDAIMSIAPMAEKLSAFGWDAVEVNGHSIEQLYLATMRRDEKKPLAIIAHTIKARGLPSLENTAESHHSAIKQEDYDFMMKNLQEGKYDRIQ